jgi:hypothetical protein
MNKRARMRSVAVWTAVAGLALAGGCAVTEPSDLRGALGITLEEASRIVSNDDLSPQEKRDALAEFGLDPLIINAIMSSDRLANQFGGTLRTAFDKVTGGRLSEMTPDEVQIYADGVGSAGGESLNITDRAALLMTLIFVDNEINTIEELEAFLDNPVNEVSSEIPSGALRSIFVDFDPEELRDQVFG